MDQSAEMLSFVTDYICNYENKIKVNNKYGLFDEAKMFELFALEICKVWFSQSFTNLNLEKKNYPFVDLVSEDGHIFVQVTTTADIPSKIKDTLDRINDSFTPEANKINEVFFFVLCNESIDRIKNYEGENQIGRLSFSVEKNLISTEIIIKKAQTDVRFLRSLYSAIHDEYTLIPQIAQILDEKIQISKDLIDESFSYHINREYEIDRSKIIQEIEKKPNKFLCIQGEAGSGKSALCKKLLEKEPAVLFARSEIFDSVTNLYEIWELNLSQLFGLLDGKSIVIYIDALEFIADSGTVKIDLLFELFKLVSRFDCARIVTSCRTCDSSAFLRIWRAFSVVKIDVPHLNDEEISLLSKRYPIIRDKECQKSYSQLLKSPFYVDLIVSRLRDLNEITTVSDFRNEIWNEVICVGYGILPNNVTKKQIRDTVISIVLTRANDNTVGVSCDLYNDEVIRLLKSYEVLTSCSGNKVRLKFDIYEDIVFEHIIDEWFDDSNGDRLQFFEKLNEIGRGVYRRYQIWVENKLMSKEESTKYLYEIIKKDNLDYWKKQTIIGIVKSYYCGLFFDSFSSLFDYSLLHLFIDVVNKSCYEVSLRDINYGNYFTYLVPNGKSRKYLIGLLVKETRFQKAFFKEASIGICADYSLEVQSGFFDETAARNAYEIVKHYFIQELEREKNSRLPSFNESMKTLLGSIYRMVAVSNEWIEGFWDSVIDEYRKDDSVFGSIYGDIILFTLRESSVLLAKYLPTQFCKLASVYWIENEEKEEGRRYRSHFNDDYGLSRNVSSYPSFFEKPDSNLFLKSIALFDFFRALDWLIGLTNIVCDYCKCDSSYSLNEYPIRLIDGSVKVFWGNADFWVMDLNDSQINRFVTDSIYLLEKEAEQKVIVFKEYDKHLLFADKIKSIILEKSNNIIMLAVLEMLGLRFVNELPGYALELASNIDLILLDNSRVYHLHPNADIKYLETQIISSFGLVDIPKRYQIEERYKETSLQTYFVLMQIKGDERTRQIAKDILAYLYKHHPNEKNEAFNNLQIQKMDLSKMTMQRTGNDTAQLTPVITGEARKVVEKGKKSPWIIEQQKSLEILEKLASRIQAKDNPEKLLHECMSAIDECLELLNGAVNAITLQKNLTVLFVYAFKQEKLPHDKLSQYCDICIDWIRDYLDHKPVFIAPGFLSVVFALVESPLNENTRNRLKRLMLDILLGSNSFGGNSRTITTKLNEYLSTNSALARILRDTIVAISEDKMNNYIHDVISAKKHHIIDVDFISNRTSPPLFVEKLFSKKHIPLYKSKTEELIESHLINEIPLNYEGWTVCKCDISTLCAVINCGLSLDDQEFKLIAKGLLTDILEIKKQNNETRDHSDFLNSFSVLDVEEYFKKKIIERRQTEKILEIVFSDQCLACLCDETLQFYDGLTAYLQTMYFDSSKDEEKRRLIEKVFGMIGEKLDGIVDNKTRIRLSRMMFVYTGPMFTNDFNDYETSFSFIDKQFLNQMWAKYGRYHFVDLMYLIYHYHIGELLPDVIIPIHKCLEYILEGEGKRTEVVKVEQLLNLVFSKAIVDFNAKIKQDCELATAFEGSLELLDKAGIKYASVLLDDYRVH